MSPKQQRYGRHVRAVMLDQRWALLPLAARAAWLQLTDIADVMPELRQPSAGRAVSRDELIRFLSARGDELDGALAHLVERQIVEKLSHGFRLKAY
ncbi:hypothetical protein AA23498_3436 [Acetobacter nitrogenifigens DSM 23921 = NBRC 105050]|uniref:hypothetical protein n=1 Tax=Acetobacter nitrogenifigens TaxID=285268 RepID=UPI002156E6F0|nr:hypothetical protein [Acetobacter nitrogenifigens]GBQ99205.1 hypothetical protein AA23498_3436 [Acetobacter nitrogenifigens DSM 23921 = NBRC 105050]